MVLLHHEVEVEFPDSQRVQSHRATLLEFGKVEEDGKTTTAMALTVGIPAAIGALVIPSVAFLFRLQGNFSGKFTCSVFCIPCLALAHEQNQDDGRLKTDLP